MSRLRFFVPGFFVPGAFPERSFLGGGTYGLRFQSFCVRQAGCPG